MKEGNRIMEPEGDVITKERREKGNIASELKKCVPSQGM